MFSSPCTIHIVFDGVPANVEHPYFRARSPIRGTVIVRVSEPIKYDVLTLGFGRWGESNVDWEGSGPARLSTSFVLYRGGWHPGEYRYPFSFTCPEDASYFSERFVLGWHLRVWIDNKWSTPLKWTTPAFRPFHVLPAASTINVLGARGEQNFDAERIKYGLLLLWLCIGLAPGGALAAAYFLQGPGEWLRTAAILCAAWMIPNCIPSASLLEAVRIPALYLRHLYVWVERGTGEVVAVEYELEVRRRILEFSIQLVAAEWTQDFGEHRIYTSAAYCPEGELAERVAGCAEFRIPDPAQFQGWSYATGYASVTWSAVIAIRTSHGLYRYEVPFGVRPSPPVDPGLRHSSKSSGPPETLSSPSVSRNSPLTTPESEDHAADQ